MLKVDRIFRKEWAAVHSFIYVAGGFITANNIETKVLEIAENILKNTDIEIFDVEYVKERDWYLRIYIDKENGIDHNDCQKVSELIEKELDDKDLIKNPYILEVSSPGLDRPLKKPKDFLREIGKKIDVTLFAPINGEKEITGVLISYNENILTIDDKEIPTEKIANARLHIDF